MNQVKISRRYKIKLLPLHDYYLPSQFPFIEILTCPQITFDPRVLKHSPSRSSLKFARQLLSSTLFSVPPFQYRGKSGRAAVYGSRRRAGKSFNSPWPPPGRQKVLPSGVGLIVIPMSGKSFTCCGLGVGWWRVDACATVPPQRWRDSPVQDFTSIAGI